MDLKINLILIMETKTVIPILVIKYFLDISSPDLAYDALKGVQKVCKFVTYCTFSDAMSEWAIFRL